MDDTPLKPFFDFAHLPWEQRLAFVVEMMREISGQVDPQEMVRAYSQRMRAVMPSDAYLSLSRRDLEAPKVRVTRSSSWGEAGRSVNPWKQKDRLPLIEGGLLARLIYGNEPAVIDDLRVDPGDPAAPYFQGMRSAVAVPLFDKGESLNMVIQMRKEPGAFRREGLPEHVWMANLFGRATQNLVLSGELKKAYQALDEELQVVADIQRSLLPAKLPEIPGLDLAAYYQTSRRAGGDYYDFFPLPDGRWGMLIADVSGHGTPAAVVMAITHSIAHTHAGPPEPPGQLLTFINRHLTARYTNGSGTFVTAFFGIYDPARRRLTYASAGHPPPRVRDAAGNLRTLEGTPNLPLGIEPGVEYEDAVEPFAPGDSAVFYTDGITEARGGPDGMELFGTGRLDAVLTGCDSPAAALLACTLESVEAFTAGRPATDDRTLLVVKVL